MDQIFTIKCLCEKFWKKGREVYMAFMDLEKAYDSLNREALWKVMCKYGVRSKLLDAVKCFYVNSRVCVRVDGVKDRKFKVKV